MPSRSQASRNAGEGGLWLVRMALKPLRLHQLDAALFGAVNRRRAQQAVVVMHAAAFELDCSRR